MLLRIVHSLKKHKLSSVIASNAKSISLVSAVKIDALPGNLCFIDTSFIVAAHPTMLLSLDSSVKIEVQNDYLSLISKHFCMKIGACVSFFDRDIIASLWRDINKLLDDVKYREKLQE